MFIYEIYILYSTCKPQSLFKCILQNAYIVYTGKWFESDTMFIDIYIYWQSSVLLSIVSNISCFPSRDLKTTYLNTVDRLSDSCDNDGLLAILEMFGELATELRDIIAMGLTQTGLSLNEICFDVIVNATATAKESLSTDSPKGLWGLWSKGSKIQFSYSIYILHALTSIS